MTNILFTVLLLLLALQRLFELRLSRRNEARILARGGREHFPGHLRVMKLLHAGWFIAMFAEVFFLERPFIPLLAMVALILFIIGQVLRYAAIRTLDWQWTVRIMTIPGVEPVHHGIYRYMRHPNYLGVILEILAVPLLHTAFLTAIIFSIANSFLLTVRIPFEEKALDENSKYEQIFTGLPRFIPNKFGYMRGR